MADPQTSPKKPGVLSTEFYLPAAAVAGLQYVLDTGTATPGVQIAASLSIGAIAVAYIASRTWLKVSDVKATGATDTAASKPGEDGAA